MRPTFLVFFYFIILHIPLHAQEKQPLIQNYPHQVYQGRGINTQIFKDSRGVLYIGNTGGLVEYDGHHWRKIDAQYTQQITSTDAGVIYFLFGPGLGRIEVDETGQTYHIPLYEKMPKFEEGTGPMLHLATDKETVYFASATHAFRYQNDKIDGWSAPKNAQITTMIKYQGKVCFAYILESTTYLATIQTNQLAVIDSLPKRCSLIMPYKKDTLIIGHSYGGFQRFPNPHPGQTDELFTEINTLLRNNPTTEMPKYYQGNYLLGTYKEGLAVFDEQFKLKGKITETSSTLISDNILNVTIDDLGKAWISTSQGFSRINWSSPVRYWDKKQGLRGTVYSLKRINGRIYVGTATGLFTWDDTKQQFERIDIPGPDCLSIRKYINPEDSTDVRTLAMSNSYILEIENKTSKTIFSRDDFEGVMVGLMPDPLYKHRVWVLLADGLASMRMEKGKWIAEKKIPNFSGYCLHMISDDHDDLWLSAKPPHKVNYLKRKPGTEREFDIQTYTVADHGVSPRELVFPSKVGDHIVIGGRYLDAQRDTFLTYEQIGTEHLDYFADVLYFEEMNDSLIWVTGELKNARLTRTVPLRKQENGTYQLQLYELADIPDEAYDLLFAEDDGKIWFSSNERLYCYDINAVPPKYDNFNTLIRQVIIGKDSLLFGGNHTKLVDSIAVSVLQAAQPQTFQVPWTHNRVRFSFAATDYEREAEVEFQYFLDGFDKEWSDWATSHNREYTYLREGKYTFRVRAKNAYHKIGSEAQFSIQVLPPWYRTNYAYVCYIVLAILLIIIAARLNNRRLEKILAKQREINHQLKQADKLKDEFLANTSHELRTPLNGIIGLADSMLDGIGGELSPINRKNLNMISMSGKRLSGLINDILDFSKMKDKKLVIQKQALDMRTLSEVVLMLSQPLLTNKEVTLQNDISEDTPLIDGDENRLQQVLLNLIGNAIKFTDSGSITIQAQRGTDDSAHANQLIISVIDTGIGIPEEKFEQIFQSFEQAEGDTAREYGGTGLGLAVTRQLVELHGGKIWVDSKVGVGSTFSFTLPISSQTQAFNSEHQSETTILHELREGEEDAMLPITQVDDTAFRILVVDDEPVNLQVLENQLSLNNYEVIKANDGFEALEIIEQAEEPFDLMVLDVMMPKMSGYEVCQKVRKQYLASELPIVMLTAKNQVSDLISGFEAGANDYLTKPFTKGELLSRIHLHLELLTKARELEDYNQNLEKKVQERTEEITMQNEELHQQKEEILAQRDNIEVQRDEIESKKLELEKAYDTIQHKNRHITDSIRYAKSIQTAILPLKDELDQVFNEHFILYRPKDIVSGDFYWFHRLPASNGETTEKIYMAVVDCTGHGVPGAFMSMVGNTLLNDILKHRKVYQPAQVLELLDRGVYNVLRQADGHNDDGMDVCLALFEKQGANGSIKLTYAGAKRPLLYHHHQELSIIKGDKRAIGGVQKRERPFTEAVLTLQAGDAVFLMSDGINDQFSEERRKFSSHRLRSLLREQSQMSMHELKTTLEVELTQHQGNAEQIDDITVIGIRL
ncbi:MAG: ATP-binding protein [Flammeovirgaceae bacterium]